MTIAIAIIVALFMVYCCNMLWSIYSSLLRQQQELQAFYLSMSRLFAAISAELIKTKP